MTPMTPRTRRYRWLLSENKRAWAAVIPTTIVAFIGSIITSLLTDRSVTEAFWQSILWGWTTFALAHSMMTWLAFRGLAGAELIEAVEFEERNRRTATGLMRRGWVRWMTGSEGAPSWSVQLSLMALIGLGALLLNSSLRTPVLMISGALLVAASWVNVWVMYALQYARLDVSGDVLTFPGRGIRNFTDYLYLSLATQTSFGPSDVTVDTVGARRTMMTHAAVAFAYNSVIMAMLVSLIMSGL